MATVGLEPAPKEHTSRHATNSSIEFEWLFKKPKRCHGRDCARGNTGEPVVSDIVYTPEG